MESGLTKAQVISELGKSPHGDLSQYVRVCGPACREDPEFFAHLIAWNHAKGEIRDAKAALPVIQLGALTGSTYTMAPYMIDNALAHLADLNPRMLVRALDFGRTQKAPTHVLRRFVTRYLRDLEADRRDFDTTALQHKASLRRLYTYYHVDATEFARMAVIEARSVEGKFGIVRQLPSMTPLEVVNAVDKYKLPWLVVRGALGVRAREPEMLMALIGRMTAADLATSAKWMIRAGVKDHPETRAAFEQLLVKAAKPRRAKGTALKAGKAAKVLQDLGEEKTAGKLQAVQERQLDTLQSIEGNWLIIGDKSSSMAHTIEIAKQLAGLLARLVKGHVYLVFADTDPRPVGDVSGKSLEAIQMTTAAVEAHGGTSIGVGLDYALAQRWELDGIAIVSDGAENSYPSMAERYMRYCQTFQREPTVYWYRTAPDADPRTPTWIRNFVAAMGAARSGMTEFNLIGADAYSLPNLAQTMRVGKYSLVDEIMTYKLRTLDEVLARTVGMGVIHGTRARAAS